MFFNTLPGHNSGHREEICEQMHPKPRDLYMCKAKKPADFAEQNPCCVVFAGKVHCSPDFNVKADPDYVPDLRFQVFRNR